MSAWRRLPSWARWALGLLAALVVLYVFGFLLFSCGSDTGSGITPTGPG
jgi:type VI protein secretion system component VasF